MLEHLTMEGNKIVQRKIARQKFPGDLPAPVLIRLESSRRGISESKSTSGVSAFRALEMTNQCVQGV